MSKEERYERAVNRRIEATQMLVRAGVDSLVAVDLVHDMYWLGWVDGLNKGREGDK